MSVRKRRLTAPMRPELNAYTRIYTPYPSLFPHHPFGVGKGIHTPVPLGGVCRMPCRFESEATISEVTYGVSTGTYQGGMP